MLILCYSFHEFFHSKPNKKVPQKTAQNHSASRFQNRNQLLCLEENFLLDLKVGSEAKQNLMVILSHKKLTQSTSYSTFLSLINSRRLTIFNILFLTFFSSKFPLFVDANSLLIFVFVYYNPKLRWKSLVLACKEHKHTCKRIVELLISAFNENIK
jgi:hypothetical protein